jgi:hypothetical protein
MRQTAEKGSPLERPLERRSAGASRCGFCEQLDFAFRDRRSRSAWSDRADAELLSTGVPAEAAMDLVGTVGENLLEIGPHEKAKCEITERSERQLELDPIGEACAISFGFEGVEVAPEPIGTAELGIDEARARFVLFDAGAPAERETAERDRIVDDRARPHLELTLGSNAKAQEGRGELFEVLRGFEEGYDSLGR